MQPYGNLEFATAAAKRCQEACSLPLLTIISIIASILPLVSRCFQTVENVGPDEVQSRLVAAHKADPEKIERRLAKKLRAESKRKSNERITKDDARHMALAIIEEAYVADAVTMTAHAKECFVGVNVSEAGGDVDDDDEGADA